MVAVFLNVPEQHAGNPLSFSDALARLEMLQITPTYEQALTLGGYLPARQGAWLWMLSCLKTGATPAFVQATNSGRYAKVPSEYWNSFSILDEAPAVLDTVEDAAGLDDSLIGEPLLIWETGLDPIYPLLQDLTASMMDGLRTAVGALSEQRFSRSSRWCELTAWFEERNATAPIDGYSIKEDEAAGAAVGISRDKVRELRRAFAPATPRKDGPKTTRIR